MSAGIAEKAVERWEHAGLECCIVRGPVLGKNGYVRLPEPFRSRKVFYGDIDVDAHGGLTYGADEAGWVGFDTAHLDDNWIPDSPDEPESPVAQAHRLAGMEPPRLGSRPWTTERLRAEVNSLAERLSAWLRANPDFESEFSEEEKRIRTLDEMRAFSALVDQGVSPDEALERVYGDDAA